MSRQDMCRALEHQLLRPTDVGAPEKFSAAEINEAVKRWEFRRGMTPTGNWFEQHRAKRESRGRDPEKIRQYRATTQARLTAEQEERAAHILANPEAYSALQVARTRVEHARRIGGEAAVRAERARIRQDALDRAAAKRQEKMLAAAAVRLANLSALKNQSRVRTLIEHTRRTQGEAAVLELRKQFADERRARKAAEQRERRARQKKQKQK